MKVKSYPIQSNATIELIEKELRKKSETYYIIFRLLLETGMPLEVIPTLKCCDINKNAITFRPAQKASVRTQPLSQRLQDEIAAYLDGRNDESYAFSKHTDKTKPIFRGTFQASLDSISKMLSLDPPCTSTSLKKTYILNLLRAGDIKKIYKMTDCRSIKQIYEYLGIDMPVMKNDKYMESHSNYSILIENNVIPALQSKVNTVLDDINKALTEHNGISHEYCRNVLAFARKIEDAIEEFNLEKT